MGLQGQTVREFVLLRKAAAHEVLIAKTEAAGAAGSAAFSGAAGRGTAAAPSTAKISKKSFLRPSLLAKSV